MVKVFFLVEAEPRHKTGVTNVAVRQTMVQMAIADYPNLDLLNAPNKRFTVKSTLPWLRQKFADSELTLLLGSDVVRGFAKPWPNLDQLLEAMNLAVGLRGADSAAEIRPILTGLQVATKTDFIQTDFHGAAAGEIRRAAGESDMLHPDVKAFIVDSAMYS